MHTQASLQTRSITCTFTLYGLATRCIFVDTGTVTYRLYLLQVETARSLSQAFSGGLPSPACAISISAAPAAISQMDLSASSVTLTQPAASSASASSVPPAVAAQHAHLGSDADSHPVPSPNYRMDHVLADSLHNRLHASHDFGPMSLVSAMSNDENLTPAASTDFSQAARPVFQRADTVQEAAPEVHSLLYCNGQGCSCQHTNFSLHSACCDTVAMEHIALIACSMTPDQASLLAPYF